MLQKYPALLKEENLLGQTPFYLAAGNPACLRLLLESLRPADSDLRSKTDAGGDNLLAYVAAFSLKQCRRCTCAASLVLLLKTNVCRLQFGSILRDLFDTHISLRCKIKYINHLKHRGEILKRLALDSPFWTAADTNALKLDNDHTLDAYTTPVTNLLRMHGVQIPISFLASYRGINSVYHFIRDAADAEEFYCRGFRDVAVADSRGFVPVDMASLPPSYLSWLVEHGAPLTSVLGRYVSEHSMSRGHVCGTSVAHNKIHGHQIAFRVAKFVGYDLGELPGVDFRREVSSVKLLNTALLPIEVADDCNCPCSDGGCTPWIDMIKGLTYERPHAPFPWDQPECYGTHHSQRVVSSVSLLAERFSFLLGTANGLLDGRHMQAAIRFLTFTGLGMTHVCCWPCLYSFGTRPEFHRWHTCEEAREIRELESTELRVLEDLVAEFSERLNLQSSSKSVDDAVLDDFWTGQWVSRIQEASECLKGTADYEQDIKGGEDIGVVWRETDEEEELSAYAHYVNTIDDIMEDARELLKVNSG